MQWRSSSHLRSIHRPWQERRLLHLPLRLRRPPSPSLLTLRHRRRRSQHLRRHPQPRNGPRSCLSPRVQLEVRSVRIPSSSAQTPISAEAWPPAPSFPSNLCSAGAHRAADCSRPRFARRFSTLRPTRSKRTVGPRRSRGQPGASTAAWSSGLRVRLTCSRARASREGCSRPRAPEFRARTRRRKGGSPPAP
jgi:hypothetical protein